MSRPPRCPVDPAHGPMTRHAFLFCAKCRGAVGGLSRSAAKIQASSANARKAMAARRAKG